MKINLLLAILLVLVVQEVYKNIDIKFSTTPVEDIQIEEANVLENMIPTIFYDEINKTVTFTITNESTNMFTFHFESAQQISYQIKNKDGEVVQQSPKDKQMPNLPSTFPVKPGGHISNVINIEKLEKGDYTIQFVLLAKEIQPKSILDFHVN